MAGGSRPTMKDVARTARVSLKTVSRVVNGEPTVAPDLAARVHAAVESLHYRPHLGASMLRRNDRRTRTIGVLLADLAGPFSAALHRAIADEASLRDVQVLAGSTDEDPHRERELTAAFTQRHADGLIVAPSGPDQCHLRSLTDIPVVLVDRPSPGLPADTILATNTAGAHDAVRHMLARGHRRIAFLGDHDGVATVRDRYRGYLTALTDAGVPAVEPLGWAEATALALLDGPTPPTAIFTAHHLLTIDAVRALRLRGLHRRIALVGFDDFPAADLLDPGITVVAQDPARMGRTAARALLERIDGMTGPPREFWIPTNLIRRGSGEIPPPVAG
ncbi:LacI family DNA-binding transcriptional regulator [Actinoplanes sp. NPDC049265]|uniref:LacI family DNA-binding transcriptional regulator n=1 Tax=Actinoplanes sp. NPDC049265 TaxID=3363902 RepID=UPI003721A4D2